MHALSELLSDVVNEPDGSLSLRFLPGFLAKNQNMGSPSPIISIKSPRSLLAADDEATRSALCELCEPTGSARRLFAPSGVVRFSWNEIYKDDIRRSTVYRWLREVITAACARPRSELSVFSPRPHEIRAWASSLAFANSISLNNLLDTAYWKSSRTFIQCYLRDVSCLQEDGYRGISSKCGSPAVHLGLLCSFSFPIFQTLYQGSFPFQ